MTFDDLQAQAKLRYLSILGGFHPDASDDVPEGTKTLLMLGPDEPAFWLAFTSSDEWQSGDPDPMDRWSACVIGAWARDLEAQPLFPFGGPPYLPFFSWAVRTGRIHISPIMLLVHDTAGLFVSFRGALALKETIDLPTPPPSPCKTCLDRPCASSCPVQAFTDGAYDVPACKNYLNTAEGSSCMSSGCAARRSCPVSQNYPRDSEQSAYHMTTFKG